MKANELANRTQKIGRIARGQHQQGMTLIEIMVVLAIIALVAGGVAVNVMDSWITAQERAALVDVKALKNAVFTYRMVHPGECPDIAELLEARHVADDARTKDPWKQEFVIKCEANKLDVYSIGQDGIEGTDDDIR